MKYKQVIFMLLMAMPQWAWSEGTRELQPESDQYQVHLFPCTNTSDYQEFATQGARAEYRLWVSIAEAGERILFGFNRGSTNVDVCIKDNTGDEVFPYTPIPNSGAGYIGTWAQAVAGPNTINPSGYTPFSYTAPTPGDYFIEFSIKTTSSVRITLFDVTVVNSSNVEQQGRLWSQNWQFYMQNSDTKFYGKLYPYTNDQITTEINFNGMAPARFTVSCNSTGCDNTGNFINDRKSRTGCHTYPSYKIFVNNPDEVLFPTGIVGGVDSVKVSNPCDGSVDVTMFVNKQGIADILLDINPLPGIQSEDVTLTDTVFEGVPSVLHWDGLNGLGETVPNGTTFNIEVTYINGLTHLPLYDVEFSNENPEEPWWGFIVNLIRPEGTKPRVYWDDSALNEGTTNLNGCISLIGCHSWGYSTGDMNTVNTWWYSVSSTLAPITLQYRRSETIPISYILCEGDSVNIFGNWVSQPGVFRDTATNFMGCDSITEITLTVLPGPGIDLGPDQLLCHGESTTLGYVVPNVSSYVWNTIPPQASPLGTSPTLTINTTATYQVQITASNGCIRTDQVHVTVAPAINQNFIRHN